MGRTRTLDDQLPAVEPEVDLRVLSEGLADEDPEVREECAQKLANAKRPEAAPFLRHALDDDAEQVRMWGAFGLGLLAREEDRDALSHAAKSDESPLVRVWATFGLAQIGDATAAPALVAFLDLPDLELKSNAADALLSLDDPSHVRPLLKRRLESAEVSADERKRVWTAAVLCRLGHKEAFALWREGLVHPQTRVDAAMVAPHLKSIAAARELVRVVAELTEEELDAPVPEANDLPLAELLTAPLLDLDLSALLQTAAQDAELRSNLLRIVLRSPMADPEVLGQLYEFAGDLDPAALGRDVGDILGEHGPGERLALLSRMTDFAAAAVLPAIEALSPDDRNALFDAIAEAAAAPTDDNAHVAPVLQLLRTTRFASQFEDLPPAPWGDEPQTDIGMETVDADDEEAGVAALIERMAAGEALTDEERKLAEDALEELGMTAEEFVESLHAEGDDDLEPIPPEPEQVASRMLALGAVLERAQIERDLAA
ncbi:MAG: HEAT repeat domain-containing protein, partial [Myxococcaceae bacterium]|nr:HEAT repeat domain-containing protein [Myxococcaceae bacterium]